LGGEIEIPTLDGHAQINIPSRHKLFRLRDKDIKALRSSDYGNLMCHVAVETPVKLTDRQEEMLRELEEINQMDAQGEVLEGEGFLPKRNGFFQGSARDYLLTHATLRNIKTLGLRSRRAHGHAKSFSALQRKL
jgi:DnaJ-class molecular chaperone